MSGHRHPPSHARALVTAAKRGAPLGPLHDEARTIADPSHGALALFALSGDPRIRLFDAERELDAVIGLVKQVDRDWRRAEVIVDILQRTRQWRGGGKPTNDARNRFQDALITQLMGIPPGEARAQAIQGAARHARPEHLRALWRLTHANPGFEHEGAKAILRAVPHGHDANEVRAYVDAARSIRPPLAAAKLLGYFLLQVEKSPRAASQRTLVRESAIAAGWAIPDPAARLEALRYMASQFRAREDLEALHETIPATAATGDAATLAAHLLATLGGRADKLKDREASLRWLEEGLAAAHGIENAPDRVKAQMKFADAFLRSGSEEGARRALADALTSIDTIPDPEHAEALRERVTTTIEGLDGITREPVNPAPKPTAAGAPSAAAASPSPAEAAPTAPGSSAAPRAAPGATAVLPPVPSGTMRHVLALYDTYEGGIKSTHLRAIARAAPLCAAFGLDLALVGFPTKDLAPLLDAAERETRIGGGGRHLRALADAERIHLVPATRDAPPEDWGRLGIPVATTSRPDRAKSTDLAGAAKHSPTGRICLIMGLGRSGLPDSLLDQAPLHFEITGANVSLETATAMGILAERLRAFAQR